MPAFKKIARLVSFSILLLLPLGVQAQETSGLGLSISPLKTEITVNPGDSYAGAISVSNPSTESVTLYPLVRDFAPSDDPAQSAPKFLEDSASATSITLARWVSFKEDSLVLQSLETKPLHYTVKVPTDAETGGHYGAIFVTNQNGSAANPNSVSISARIGSLLFIKVSGETKLSGSISQFSTEHKLYSGQSINLKTTFVNTGNIHFQPSGSIVISNRLTRKETTIPFNEDAAVVLPSSQRIFNLPLTGLGYGLFTINAKLVGKAPGGDNFPLTATTTIWILPLTAMAIGAGILIFLLIVFRIWLMLHDRKVLKATISPRKKG